jgi:hypothetical protein
VRLRWSRRNSAVFGKKNRTRSTRLYERIHSNFYQTRKTANAKGDLMHTFPNTTFVDNHAHVRIIRQNLMVVFSSPPRASAFAIRRDPPPRPRCAFEKSSDASPRRLFTEALFYLYSCRLNPIVDKGGKVKQRECERPCQPTVSACMPPQLPILPPP